MTRERYTPVVNTIYECLGDVRGGIPTPFTSKFSDVVNQSRRTTTHPLDLKLRVTDSTVRVEVQGLEDGPDQIHCLSITLDLSGRLEL